MYLIERTPVFAWALALCAGVWFAHAVDAQGPVLLPNEAGETHAPGLELDTAALLNDDRVFEDSVDGNIWSIKAQPGRRLIQLPMVVTPTDGDTRLASPQIKLRGGRFIAWRIVQDPQTAGQAGGAASRRIVRRDDVPSIRNLRGLDVAGLDQLGQSRDQGSPPPRQALGRDEPDEALPDGVPILTRDMTVTSSGSIVWGLERAIPGGEIKTGTQGYFLKLRPDRLKALEPKRPERQTRSAGGQNSRESAAKRRDEENKFRDQAKAYRELRDEVRKLPDEFQARLPKRLWAVFEVSDRFSDFSFNGPPPMPWRLSQQDMQTLRETASRSTGGSGGELSTKDFTAISQMTLLLADEHPLTQRMVANTLAQAGLFGQAKTGGALYRLIEGTLAGSDPQAKRTITAGLAKTLPPTPATLGLLKNAFANLDPASKLLALGGMLATENNDPVGQRNMLETANQMIADPDGPGVVYVLSELARAVADKPDVVTLVGSSIRFDSLSAASLDQAIIYTADASEHSAVAAEWMENGLLGSASPTVVRRTVELLGTSAPNGGAVSQITKAMIEAGFGPATKNTANQPKPQLRGIARIPIGSAGHSIYRVLNAGDPDLRALGWKALKHFQVYDDPSARNRSPQAPAGEPSAEPDRLDLILDAALRETVTPPQMVAFLVNQQDPQAATRALVRIVVEGRGPTITLAARSLVRSGRELTDPLHALDADQRGAFSARLYEAVTGSSPMFAALLRTTQPNAPLIDWFARYVSTSGLPDANAWAQAAGGEDQLLTLAASSDPDLADAAVSALVASAGGDTLTARDLARRLANATDRSVGALREQWATAKKEIYISRLSHAAGRYRLIVNLRGSSDTTFNDAPPFGGGFSIPSQTPEDFSTAPLIKSFNIAGIELIADGQSLSLSSGTLTLGVSDARLAILLQDPGELKEFGDKELNQLPFEQITEPIELLPQGDRSWRGGDSLQDGRSVEVVFEPQ
jgi:hypothetical protein